MRKIFLVGESKDNDIVNLEYMGELFEFDSLFVDVEELFNEDYKSMKPYAILFKFENISYDNCNLVTRSKEEYNSHIFVASNDLEKSNRLRWLSVGVTDYLQIPFFPEEFYRKLKSLLCKNSRYVVEGELELDLVKQQVQMTDRIAKLTPSTVKLLYYLITNKDRIIPRDELLEYITGDVYYLDDRKLDTVVRLLRKEIGSDYIVTHFKEGYSFKPDYEDKEPQEIKV